MGRSARAGQSALLAVLIASALVPGTLAGQDAPASSTLGEVQWEVRFGMGKHRDYQEYCAMGKALMTGGLAFRTGGPLVLGGSLELVGSSEPGCSTSSWHEEYDGQAVTAFGRSGFRFAPRLSFQAGGTLELGGLIVEPGTKVGLVRTITDYRSLRTEQGVASWQPSVGALIGLQGSSRIGARLEVGRQRYPRHYYSAGERIAKIREWEPYTEVTAYFPLGGLSQAEPSVAQTELPIEIAIRLGMAWHSNDCVRESAVGMGLAAHSHRPLLVGMAVDLTESQDNLCVTVVDPLPGGDEPELGGRTHMDGAPRITTWVGYGVPRDGGWLELAPLFGLVHAATRYDYGYGLVEDRSWQPLLGGTAVVHREAAGFGAQLTIGKQRDPLRAYSAQGDLLAEGHRWSWFFELAGTAGLR